MIVSSFSLGSFGKMSWINSKKRLICLNLSYRWRTMEPSAFITPKSIKNGTGIPSFKIYCLLLLWSRLIFCGIVLFDSLDIFCVFIVTFPFLLTRIITDSVAVISCVCLKYSVD